MTVNLVEPGTLHGDRVTSSTSAWRKFSDSGSRTNVGLDIYNVTNSAPVLTYNEMFIPDQAVSTWLRPTSVLQPRYIKFSAQMDF